jgi:DMSO/TMAO reductase YedYZ heme-binding membrane subunit
MISDAALRPVQMFLVQKKSVILQFCFAAYLLLGAVYVVGVPLFGALPKNFSVLLEIGGKFGTISVLFYALTLMPGILKRLQILPVIQVSLMLFRRQFGILMFLFAINHSGYSLLFPTLALTGAPPMTLSTREIFGTIAEFVLFPLFITSNDLSLRKLGKWWKVIHKLTYVALLFIFGHIVLLGGELTLKLLVGGLIGLELISWIVYWRRPSPVVPPPATPSPVPQPPQV